ncbi:BamA/TamA family outer membrane protein [Candidatus Bipolaricaulota bacterium]|nr:BamA/TamA family outer membrane protein [Candidatus Bipolaricaulota bacterium]
MLRKTMGVLLAALIAGSAIGWAVQYPLTVMRVDVNGNDEIKLRDILKAVPFEVGDEIEEAEIRDASQAIFDLGWFEEVAIDRAALEAGNVVFQVVENPVIRKIVIEGNVNRQDYSLFGVKLFDAPVMSAYKVRQILWRNDVRKRSVLNQDDLNAGLEEVKAEYQKRGYVLISIADVDVAETLTITFMEHLYSGSLLKGLATVPESVVQELVEMPVGQPVRMTDVQRANTALSDSIFFSEFSLEPQIGLDPINVWIRWTLTERKLWDGTAAIDRVSIQGNTVYDDELLLSYVGELPAQIEGNFGMLSFVKGIHDRYVRGGYSMVEISVVSADNGELVLNVAEGVISQITILGNTHTHDYVIERNAAVEVGNIFNRKSLVVTYQQLMSLGYFSSLDIVREWGETGVEVTITVREKSDLGGFGGSMAIDPSTGELFGELTLNEKNIFGTGQDLELSYNRGLIGPDDTNPSTWNLGYSTVAYFPGFSRVGVDFYQKSTETKVDEIEIMTTTLGGQVSFSYPVADYSNAGLSFRHEEERVRGDAFWTPSDVISLTLTYDDTNDPFFPTEGNRHRLSMEKAGGFSAGLEYAKFDFTWTHFVPAVMPLISADIGQALAIRIKAGWGDDRVPVSRLMELGGSTSIRGVTGSPARQYVFANVEYRLELVEGFYATAFVDGGFDLTAVRFEDLLSTTGFELGINAAGIVVRLDFVWMLNEEFTWIPVFDFGFGQMF